MVAVLTMAVAGPVRADAEPASTQDAGCAGCLILTSMLIQGVSAYPLADLADTYDQQLARRVSVDDLVQSANAITARYRNDGYFLTRAVVAETDPAIGAAFEAMRCDILRRPRDLPALRGEITAMREKMHAAHPNRSGLFDVKHDSGGIVDVEFLVQYLVLGHAHNHAALTGNIGNLALLELAARLDLIPAASAAAARQAYRAYRQIQHTLRLRGERYARVAPETAAPHAAAVLVLWHRVFGNSR